MFPSGASSKAWPSAINSRVRDMNVIMDAPAWATAEKPITSKPGSETSAAFNNVFTVLMYCCVADPSLLSDVAGIGIRMRFSLSAHEQEKTSHVTSSVLSGTPRPNLHGHLLDVSCTAGRPEKKGDSSSCRSLAPADGGASQPNPRARNEVWRVGKRLICSPRVDKVHVISALRPIPAGSSSEISWWPRKSRRLGGLLATLTSSARSASCEGAIASSPRLLMNSISRILEGFSDASTSPWRVSLEGYVTRASVCDRLSWLLAGFLTNGRGW